MRAVQAARLLKTGFPVAWRRLLGLALIYPLLVSCGGSGSGSNPVPSGPPRLVTLLTGLDNPGFVTNAHDGSKHLFVLELRGRIKALPPGASTPTLYLDITSKVLFSGEQGLLSIAFHPQFAANHRFFVDYIRQSDSAEVIAEYHQSASNPAVADGNETILLTIPQSTTIHKGGMLAFGPDGYLYLGLGDGGPELDPQNHAQNNQLLLGKMLRIDVDHPSAGLPYSIPTTNPFYGTTQGRPEIYAKGFRNPWRYSFDRLTGNLYVGDVGQSSREEIDIVTLGGNYGWRIREGTLCTNLDPTLCNEPGLIGPITEYDHSGGRCAIIGGFVYRGNLQTFPQGTYIFGDYCSGEVILLQGGVQKSLMHTGLHISSFGEDEASEIYVVGLEGVLARLVPGF